MATINIKYSAATAITITAGTLAAASSRESLAIDNGTNLYTDVLVRVDCTIGAGAPSADKRVYIYAAGSEDGTNYTDNATGADAAITLRAPTNLQLIGVIEMPTASINYHWVGTVAKAFGGILPRKWSIILFNNCGDAFTANTCEYSGITYTSV